MKSENIFCPKCGSKQQGNDFCSKCGNQLIVNTLIEEPKNQKEDIPKPVIEESSEIEQQQINSLIDNNENNQTDSVRRLKNLENQRHTLKIILHFVFKFVIFVFILGGLGLVATPVIATYPFFAFVILIVSAMLTSIIKISKNERIKKISSKFTTFITGSAFVIGILILVVLLIKNIRY